jgi:hypothetical protein
MKNNAKHSILLIFLFSSQSIAQSTPSEFAEMSFDDLFQQDVRELKLGNEPKSPWSLTYQFKSVEFEGYLDGTKKLSFEDVLWNGPSEVRTDNNFPVLPTAISQKVHLLVAGYQISSSWDAHISAPYIKQNTDHISIISNYNSFALATHGIGDVAILASYKWSDSDVEGWRFSFGISLPVGSIDERGDTPRAPGKQQLPYTMQLGSGTYDIPLDLSYKSIGFSFGLAAKVRTGTNDREYRLGNSYSLNSRYEIDLSNTLQTFAGLNYRYSAPIHGQDDSLTVPSPLFPYPAGITNPDLYGGHKVNALVGFSWKVSKGYRLNLEFGKPIYQSLNGPQPKEKWRSAIGLSKSL